MRALLCWCWRRLDRANGGAPSSSGELRLSSRPTRSVASVGRCQAVRRAVANAIEAARVGQNVIEMEQLVLECVIRTCEVFLFGVESVLLIDCSARKAVSIDPVRCVGCVLSGSKSAAGQGGLWWRWCYVVCSACSVVGAGDG